MDFFALCGNLVKFGSANLEITLLEMITFLAIGQKLAYHAKYLRISWTDVNLHFW